MKPSAQTKKCFVCGTGDISPDPMVYNEKFGWFHRECSPCTVETKQESAKTEWWNNGYWAELKEQYPSTWGKTVAIVKTMLASERTRLLSVESMKMEEVPEDATLRTGIIISAKNELRQSIVKELK